MKDLWQYPVVPEVNGIVAGTKNHTGFYPRIEVVIEQGRLKEVRGGGEYGDFFRAFLNHPKLQEVQYPYYKKQGYWFLYSSSVDQREPVFGVANPNPIGRKHIVDVEPVPVGDILFLGEAKPVALLSGRVSINFRPERPMDDTSHIAL